jgi:hypothetical protein
MTFFIFIFFFVINERMVVIQPSMATKFSTLQIISVAFDPNPCSGRESFFSSSSDNMMKPYVEYRGVYGGGADERFDRRGGTGGSSVRP